MAHIRRHPTTGKPQVRWVDPWRKERSKTFTKTRDARAFMAEVEVAKGSGHYLDPKRAMITLEDWSPVWLDSRVGVSANTKTRDEALLRNHLLPDIGHLRLSDIGFEHIQVWVQDLSNRGLAPATVRKAHQVASQVLEFAVRSKRIPWNPAKGVELPSVRGAAARFISGQEMDLLADAIGCRYRLLVMLGGYCGLRWGEATALHVEQLDLLHRQITIDRSLLEVAGRLEIGTPKTASSIRQVALPNFMVNEFEAHLAKNPVSNEGLVNTSVSGTFLRRSNFRRRLWLPAVDSVGLTPLRYHDLRHSHVALLIEQGEHPKLIADRLGHASPNVTMAIYAHLFPGLDQKAAERLEAARNGNQTDFSRTVPLMSAER